MIPKGIVGPALLAQDARAHAHVFATDATGVLVQHPNACRRGHFFVAIADSDYVFFHFTPKHTHHVPLSMFEGFSGIVQADASSVYDALFRRPDAPTEAGCLAHVKDFTLHDP